MADTSTSTPASTSAPVTSAAPVSTSSTPATSAPTSTADIAADVIADLEGNGESDDSAPSTTPTPTPVSAAPVPAVDPDDIDALPSETIDSLGRKRVNTIPQPRVKTMLTKHEQKVLTNIAKELGMTTVEGTPLKLDDIIATVKEHGTKRTGYESRLQQVDAVERLIAVDDNRPASESDAAAAQFMRAIGEINPRFKEYVKKEATAAISTPAPIEDPEPQPDYDLGEGNMTYSLKGLKALREWERRQAVKEIEEKLGTRLKPVEDRLKADTEREEYNKWHTEATTRVTQRLEKARKWPKFADHEADILKAMQADQSVSLEDAYMQIVVPNLAGERTKIRQEVLAEIEAQPKTSSVAVSPTAPKTSDKPKSTADIAKEVIASMGA